MGELLTLKDAAHYYGAKKSTFKHWVRKGLIPFVRLPGGRLIRFRQEDLDAVVLAGLVNARQGKEREA